MSDDDHNIVPAPAQPAINLAALRKLAEKASQGARAIERRDDDNDGEITYVVHANPGDVAWCSEGACPNARNDARFIEAMTPGVILALLDAMDNAERTAVAYAELRRERDAMEGQLRNVLMLATRLRRKANAPPGVSSAHVVEQADHLIRFCREAGVEPTILRGDDQ